MIPRRLKIEERREIASQFANHRVYQTINLCCKPFEAQFPTLLLKVEDIFQIVCSLLDDVMNDARTFYELRTPNLMEEIRNDLKDWQNNIPEEEILEATGVILEMFAAFLLKSGSHLFSQISINSLGAISNRYPDFILKVENPITRKMYDHKIRTGKFGICDFTTQGKVYEEIQCVLSSLDKKAPLAVVFPEELKSMRAMKAWNIARSNGWVDENYQPTLRTNYEIGLLAETMARYIGLKKQWAVFGKFWNIDRGTLRSAYNKALDGRQYYDLYEKLNKQFADK
jgi:hypothetical protein